MPHGHAGRHHARHGTWTGTHGAGGCLTAVIATLLFSGVAIVAGVHAMDSQSALPSVSPASAGASTVR